jgi:hypothetical protein
MAVACAAAATAAAAAPSGGSLTGAWVLDDGDGSTSHWIFSAPGADGVRQFLLFDTYATFCEIDGQAGTGSSLVARGTAVESDGAVTITVTSANCSNHAPGAAPTPFDISATHTDDALDFGGGFVATHPGSS